MNMLHRILKFKPGDTDLSDPGFGDPELFEITVESKGRKPCRVTIKLLGVYYGGDNIGRDWRLMVTADGSYWVSPPTIINWHQMNSIGNIVSDKVHPGACDSTLNISIGVKAREKDLFFFDDIGHGVNIALVRCTPDGTTNRVTVTVPVNEYPGPIWKWLFRRSVKSALLRFYFELHAICIEE